MSDMQHLAPDRLRHFTRAEYERLVDAGFFGEERLELLRGMLVVMSPQGSPHAEAVTRLTELLIRGLSGRATVRSQAPFSALEDSIPEPDLTVTERRSYRSGHPEAADLVIEVSASSLDQDRQLKSGIYAENGVPEYWIVDVGAGEIEVRRQPEGDQYRHVRRVGSGGSVSPAAFPDVVIAIDDVLGEELPD